MFQCFKNEFLRYRLWAFGFMLVHLSYWFVNDIVNSKIRFIPKLMAVNEQASLTMFVSLSVGFVFGLLQMGLHKRVNQWIFLVHRPLAPGKIYLALAGSTFALFFLAFFVPWFTTVLIYDVFTETVVDTRHYLHGFYIFGLAYSAYLGGSYAQLSASKGGFLVVTLVIFLLGHPPNGLGHAPVTIAVFCILFTGTILWLGFLNYRAFKPDLSVPESSKPALLLAAFPMQIAFMYLVFFLTMALYLISLNLYRQHPYDFPREGTEHYFRLMNNRTGIFYLLDQNPVPDKEFLKNQVKLGDIGYSRTIPAAYPKREQIFISDKPGNMLSDVETETFWVFSHGEMLLKGTLQRTGELVGWLGKTGFKPRAEDFGGDERFTSMPLFKNNRFLQFRQTLYKIDFKGRRLLKKHGLTGDAYYYSSIQSNEYYASIASNKNLYLFDAEEFLDGDGPVEAEYVIPHPRPVRSLSHITTIRTVDGYLLSYANDYLFGGGRPGVILVRARLNGEHEQVLEKAFTDHMDPEFLRYEMMAASPLLNALVQEVIWSWIEPDERRHRRITLGEMQLSTTLKAALIGIGLLCACLTYLGSRKYGLSRSTRWMWTVMSGVFGIPGLLSFYLLSARK